MDVAWPQSMGFEFVGVLPVHPYNCLSPAGDFVPHLEYENPEDAPGPGVPQIPVSGERPDPIFFPPQWDPTRPTGPDFPYDGPPFPNTYEGNPPCQPHHRSNVPDQHPLHVNMDTMRNAALDLAEQIKGRDQSVEWAVAIVSDRQGNLHATNLTWGTTDDYQLEIDPSAIPPGDQIVAILHSHPDRGADAGWPSYTGNAANDKHADQAIINRLVTANPNGWFNPNMMQYVLDIHTGHVFEFTGKGPDGDRRDERNDVSSDMIPCH